MRNNTLCDCQDRLLGTPGYSLVDLFRDKGGAYGIPGVQRKLNLLLHGPPGTGKSKLIRTLAMYLQRHVVQTNLAALKTKQQLNNVLDRLDMIKIPGQDSHDDNKYDDFIFVLEEVRFVPLGGIVV